MKTVSLLLTATVLIIAGCKKDDDDDKAPSKKQLLSKGRIVEDGSIFLDIDYNGDKFYEIRELPRDVVIRFHDFSFDAKGRIAGFTKTTPVSQVSGTAFKHQITYVGDFLRDVSVTKEVNGTSVFVEGYEFSKSGSDIVVLRRDKNQQLVDMRIGTYDSLGNMTRLIMKNLAGGQPDTVEYTNYDRHPNTFRTATWVIGTYDFLPISANNVGTVTNRRGALPPAINQITYEYNQHGNPVKLIQKGQTMLFEYKDL